MLVIISRSTFNAMKTRRSGAADLETVHPRRFTRLGIDQQVEECSIRVQDRFADVSALERVYCPSAIPRKFWDLPDEEA